MNVIGPSYPANNDCIRYRRIENVGRVTFFETGSNVQQTNPRRSEPSMSDESTNVWRKRVITQVTCPQSGRGREYRAQNREALRVAKAAEYQRNKPKRVAKNRATRQSDPERANEYSRQWRKRNPERRRASVLNSDAKRKQAPGNCSPEQWIAKCEYFGWRCYLCGAPLTSKMVHAEHRKPISRGGSNWPANLAPACAKCNLSKNSKTEAEFRELVGFVKIPPEAVLLRIRSDL